MLNRRHSLESETLRETNAVTSASNASAALTKRYATAIIELAHDAGKTQRVEQDLDQLVAMLKTSADLQFLTRSPSISRASQSRALMAVAEKAGFDSLTIHFLGVLVHNRRLNAVEAIIRAIKEEMAQRRGEITVQVETAQDMTPAQLKSLQEELSRGMKREVTIRAKVEPSIMGGMIVTVGSQMIDDSVRRKLEKLKIAMGKQANQNLSLNEKGVG
jgi:F-type H+-transporting ATPase subunit delta